MNGVLLTKFGSQYVQPDDKLESPPTEKSTFVILSGGKCTHRLGALAPGIMEMEKRFSARKAALGAEPEKNDFLDISGWIGNGQNTSRGEVLAVVYLRNLESLHRFAHSATHLSSIKYWTELVKKHSNMGISHEVSVFPAGQTFPYYYHPSICLLSSKYFVNEKLGFIG